MHERTTRTVPFLIGAGAAAGLFLLVLWQPVDPGPRPLSSPVARNRAPDERVRPPVPTRVAAPPRRPGGNGAPGLGGAPPPPPDARARSRADRPGPAPLRPAAAPSLTALVGLDRPALRRLARQSEDVRTLHAVVWSLANRLELEDADLELLLQLLHRTDRRNARLVRALVWALSLRPDRLPVESVVELARKHDDDGVRRTASRALAATSDPRAFDSLLSSARRDPIPRNRREAVTLLGLHLDGREAVAQARRGLGAEAAAEVRAAWLNLAGQHDTAGSRELLERALRSGREPLAARRMAAEMLAGLDPQLGRRLALDPSIPAPIRRRLDRLRQAARTRPPDDLPGAPTK